jgi:hypothetical protein
MNLFFFNFTNMNHVLLLFFLSFFLRAHTQCDLINLKGKVNDTLINQQFYNVMLISKSTNKGFFGNADGSFSIFVKQKDTIVISVAGYEKIVIIPKNNEQCLNEIHIKLKSNVKYLKPIVIQPLKSIQQIKEERESLTLKESKKAISGINVIQSPITALYERFSQRARTEKKINHLKYQDEKNKILKELLSIYVVYEIFDLNEEEFDSFITFLNINDEILKNTSDIELATFIKDKFLHFKSFGN